MSLVLCTRRCGGGGGGAPGCATRSSSVCRSSSFCWWKERTLLKAFVWFFFAVGVVGGGFVWAVSMAPALHCREPKCTLRHGHFRLGGGCEKKEEEAVVLSVELAADDQRLVELLDLCLS